jgi:hypothetical protein
LVAIPLFVSAIFMVAVSLSGVLAVGPFRPDPPRNLAEALALSDSATASLMIRTGADLVAVYEVRPGIGPSEMDRHVRPLAAAAFTLDDSMVTLAKMWGGALPPAEAATVACWLSFKGRESISRMIAPPSWKSSDCGKWSENR